MRRLIVGIQELTQMDDLDNQLASHGEWMLSGREKKVSWVIDLDRLLQAKDSLMARLNACPQDTGICMNYTAFC